MNPYKSLLPSKPIYKRCLYLLYKDRSKIFSPLHKLSVISHQCEPLSPLQMPLSSSLQHEFRGRDYSREWYEAEDHITSRRSAPSSPFHPSRSPPHSRTMLQPERYYNGKDHLERMYKGDADVTPLSSPPMSHVHGVTSRSLPPPFYSSSDEEDDNSMTYLFPEIATGDRGELPIQSCKGVLEKVKRFVLCGS